jgi:ribosomal-protein-alanine N-acetyltransferase
MLIKGKRIYLEPFSSTHLYDPAYFRWLSDIEVVRYIGRDELLKGMPFVEAENYVNQLWVNKYCHFLAVHHLETGKFIGTAKINFINAKGREYGIADMGIMLGERSFWGQGLAKDILQAISIFAFDELKARKLSAGGYSSNEAVVKAFLRIGYKIDGSLRQQLAVDDGYCDHVLMSCFEQELDRK